MSEDAKAKEEALFHKVRMLLKKAESTNFEAEAELFVQKAQELIMLHAIDEEKLWASDPSRKQHITTQDVRIPDRKQGSHEKRQILNACAKTNRCRMWYSEGRGYSTIAGFPNDLIFVEMMFASILTQMNMKLAIAQAMNSVSGSVHPKTFQNEFMVSYANRIWERLHEMERKAEESVDTQSTGTSLVLADRSRAVERWVEERIKLGRGKSKSTTFKSSEAVAAGKRAADETDITGGRRGIVK